MERDATSHAPRRRLLRVETSEERLLVAILAAGLVFLGFSAVQAAVGTGSHASRARAQAAAARQAPLTTTSTLAPAPPAASVPTTVTTGLPGPAPSASPPVVHMLAVRTEPRVPDASFSFAGTTFTTDPRSGVALLLISGDEHDRLVTDPAHQLTVTTPAVPLWRGRAVFTGWAGPVRPDGALDTAVATFLVGR